VNRALDSDDIELVRLLLDEKRISLDGAHGLHYAAAYCHPRTLAHLLDLGLAGEEYSIDLIMSSCALRIPCIWNL
jgi:hypothetical protein